MNRDEMARAIATRDKLDVNLFERDRPGEFEVGIVDHADGYTIYWSTERTNVMFSERIADKSVALDKLLELLALERERRALFDGHPRRSPSGH